jgi:lipooligosaccharide transport system permease protein
VPGLLVTTAMGLAAGESMWPVMGGLTWQRGYHGIAATPLEARDIVAGHACWMALRCGLATVAVSVVLAVFPDTRSWGLLPAVLVAMLVGIAFAMPIMAFSVGAKMDGSFAAIQRFVVIPLFLFGGAFYPLSQLPIVVQWIAKVAPLWHGVVVARGFTSGTTDWPGVAGHLGYVALWGIVGGVVATRRLRGRLYT